MTSVRRTAPWVAGAVLALACCGTALAASSAHHPPAHVETRRQVDGQLQRRRFGSLHDSLEADRLAAARAHHALESEGTYGISGSVTSGKIKFGAVSVGAKYKGKVRGTSMSGTWTSPQGGGSWSATKS